MKYIYNIFGEPTVNKYEEKGMWMKTEKMPHKVRAFPFFVLVAQAVFSIRTLKLWDPEAKIEIHTNKPKDRHFLWLKEAYSNITIIDKRKAYDKYKNISFWVYRIRYEVLKDPNESVVMIDADTYFKAKPEFEMSDDVCWISEKHNMGILGLTQANCKRLTPKIIAEINEKADPDGKELRAIDEIVTLGTMKKNNIKCKETGQWIRHYFDDDALKFSAPSEGLYLELKAKALGNIKPKTDKIQYRYPEDGPIQYSDWSFKWKEMRSAPGTGIIELIETMDAMAEYNSKPPAFKVNNNG